ADDTVHLLAVGSGKIQPLAVVHQVVDGGLGLELERKAHQFHIVPGLLQGMDQAIDVVGGAPEYERNVAGRDNDVHAVAPVASFSGPSSAALAEVISAAVARMPAEL